MFTSVYSPHPKKSLLHNLGYLCVWLLTNRGIRSLLETKYYLRLSVDEEARGPVGKDPAQQAECQPTSDDTDCQHPATFVFSGMYSPPGDQ